MAQLLDKLNVDVRAEPESAPAEESEAQEVPVERVEAAGGPLPVEREEEQAEGVKTNGACSDAAPEPLDFPEQECVLPPDITSTLGQPEGARTGPEVEPRPADLLDQVSLSDHSVDSDPSGPSKPPRQFTVEPDIVASTKKPPPSRPPPPSGGPPPRPPPPSRQTLPSKKSQESLRPSGLEGKTVNDPY